MFEAVGRFCYRFRWIVIAVWLVLFGVSVVATPLLAGVLQGSFTNPDASAQQAGALIQAKFQQGPTTLLIVFKSDTLEARSKEFQAAEQQALDGLTGSQVPHLRTIQTYASTGSEQLVSKNGKSSVAVLEFTASLQTIQNEVDGIRGALKGTELQAYVTGEPAVNADLTTYSFRDLQKVELYGLPVALIALIFVFGSLVSAALPVVTGGMAVTVTLGGMYLLGRTTTMSIFAMNTATLLGLAVAIDYALFTVSRFREELHKGSSVEEAVVTTTARAGRSVFFSGLAVMVGVVGLVFFPSPGLRSMGIGGALVVFFSVAASITFMPAVLGVLGRRVNSVPVIPLRAVQASRFWTGWARVVLRRPWVSVVVALMLIGVVASPVVGMKTQMTSASTLPAASESRQGLEILDQEFDHNALSPISVLLTWEGNQSIDMARAAVLFAYGQQLTATPGVASVLSPFTITGLSDPTALATLWTRFQPLLNDPDGFTVPAEGIALDSGTTITAAQLEQFKQLVKASIAPGGVLYRVVSKDAPASSQSQDLVERLMGSSPSPGYQVHVAGESAYDRDFFKELNDWFPWVSAWVGITSLIVFIVLLRSLLLPVVAVAVNALTIAMSYGWVVFLFQGHAFEKILRFTSTGAVDATIPVVTLCVLFGITMDYAVFMLTRVHESWLKTGDDRQSVATGLVQTGRIIVSAALLVVIVTGAFAFTSIGATKMLGLGIALAIIVDALFIRMTLLPAIMCGLGGSSCWWPQSWAPRRRGPRPGRSRRRTFPGRRARQVAPEGRAGR
jgi:RND superfamily putative drug exporter